MIVCLSRVFGRSSPGFAQKMISSWFSSAFGMADPSIPPQSSRDVPDRVKLPSIPASGDSLRKQYHHSKSLQKDAQDAVFNPPMPWFGIDIGGSLVKLVYFEPDEILPEDTAPEAELSKMIRVYLTSNRAYGEKGVRDEHLEMRHVPINHHVGTLHFIRFPSSAMERFIYLAKSKGLSALTTTVCATGGGAFAYEGTFFDELNLQLQKSDELDSLISGIHYIELYNHEETFTYEHPLNDLRCVKVPHSIRDLYPYLVVNVGSGVSILMVESRTKYRRVWGTSIGGGTFLGLCCLLTGCETFEEAIALAAEGDSRNIDKLVRDIYGGDYSRFDLPGDTVASSFAQMMDSEKRKNASKQDVARAVLVTVTNNIGSIAMMCAMNHKIDKVLFLGNFLRVNTVSMRQLAYAMNFWSKGQCKALFMEHEGYFGAVGCLMEYMKMGNGNKSSAP